MIFQDEAERDVLLHLGEDFVAEGRQTAVSSIRSILSDICAHNVYFICQHHSHLHSLSHFDRSLESLEEGDGGLEG